MCCQALLISAANMSVGYRHACQSVSKATPALGGLSSQQLHLKQCPTAVLDSVCMSVLASAQVDCCCIAHARPVFVTHIVSCILQEDATEHVGAVLKRVKHEYLVSAEQYKVQ